MFLAARLNDNISPKWLQFQIASVTFQANEVCAGVWWVKISKECRCGQFSAVPFRRAASIASCPCPTKAFDFPIQRFEVDCNCLCL